MTFVKKFPLVLRLEDYRVIRNIFESLDDLTDDEKVTLDKVQKIIHNIERSISYKERNAIQSKSMSDLS